MNIEIMNNDNGNVFLVSRIYTDKDPYTSFGRIQTGVFNPVNGLNP